jgi:hypothetical protein
MRLLLANWREKIISLVLAGVLFAYVDNLKIGTVALNLPVVYTGMPQSLAFAEDPPRFLEVRLRGDKERLNFPTSKMRVEIDMKGAVVERMSYPVTLDERLLPEGVSFVEPPQFLRIKLERSVQRIVFIRPIVSGTPDAGFRRGRVTVQPDRVVIRGAEEKIRAVRELTAGPIDISGALLWCFLTIKKQLFSLGEERRLFQTSMHERSLVLIGCYFLGNRVYTSLCTLFLLEVVDGHSMRLDTRKSYKSSP